MRVTANGDGVSLWGDRNVLESEVVVAQRCERAKCHWIAQVKMVNFAM